MQKNDLRKQRRKRTETVLAEKPPFWVRWGNTVFAILFATAALIAIAILKQNIF